MYLIYNYLISFFYSILHAAGSRRIFKSVTVLKLFQIRKTMKSKCEFLLEVCKKRINGKMLFKIDSVCLTFYFPREIQRTPGKIKCPIINVMSELIFIGRVEVDRTINGIPFDFPFSFSFKIPWILN